MDHAPQPRPLRPNHPAAHGRRQRLRLDRRRPKSETLLDALLDAGLTAIDTADIYSAWAPGHSGGESERVIGDWLKRDSSWRGKVVIATKVGGKMGSGDSGLQPE